MSFIFPGMKKLVASKYVKKHQINKGDNRGTIKIYCCGIAPGADGTRSFCEGRENRSADIQWYLLNQTRLPSWVINNQNAYMTYKVWNEIAPAFAKGLQYMPVVKNYPDLCISITLDDFGYNMEGDALKVFADHKILIVKEEGDASQVCQAYDNEFAKSDKRHHCDFIYVIRCDMPCIDQWTLIIVANNVCFLFDSCMLSCLIKK